MPVFLTHDQPDFAVRFDALLSAKREISDDVDAAAAQIISEVREGGLSAVIDLTRKFDGWNVTEQSLAFSAEEIDQAIERVDQTERRALELAAARIRAYHEQQVPDDRIWTDPDGVLLGWRWGAIDAVGLYVPGGLASYPSSVLMNAIPASVAGVRDVVMTAPTPGGDVNPLVLLAARLSGVDTVYRIGGAQAVAALAYGAGPIAPVDKITGPGNAWVAAAKRRVFGTVGIDMIAGPSEILVISDGGQDPDWIAADLMSQAEHDTSAQSILITDDAGFADEVVRSVDRILQRLERREIAGASWRDHGAIIVAETLEQAAALTNRIAPEHLELCVESPLSYSEQIRHAGAIFLGGHTPEAIGDYVGGPNHVLPKARSARFSSGLSVLDFMKRTTLAQVPPASLAAIGPAAETLARSEGLEAHALSVSARLSTP
ncbi:MAG: histidinol dehydrogenase [Pseudomonadota bacterium]